MNPTTTHTPGAHRLTEAEIEIAFNYCDVHGTGLVTTAGLTARLGPLLLNNKNKGAAALDCSALLGGKPTLTLPELKAALLAPNATKGGGHHTRTPTPVPVPTTATAAALAMAGKGKGDAVAEAFGLMADRTGHIGREALAQWLRAVDFVAATERDLE